MNNGKKTSDQLIVRVGRNENQPIHWVLKTLYNQKKNEQGIINNANELISLAQYADFTLIVLVSSDCVAFRQVTLPGKINSRTMAAIPYLLEESIITDIEQLHIVILERYNNNFSVAAIESQLINQWLEWLSRAGLSVDFLFPDVLALPLFDGAWSAVKLEKQWLIRQGKMTGFVVDNDELNVLFSSIISSVTVNTFSLPETADVNWELQPFTEAMILLSNNINLDDTNLLHGKYKIKSIQNNKKIHTKKIIFFIMIILSLLIIRIYAEGYRQHQQAEYYKLQSVSLYQKFYPNEDRVQFPRLAFEKKIALIENKNKKLNLLRLMAEIQPFLLRVPKFKVNRISFNDTQSLLITGNVINKEVINLLRDQVINNLVIEIAESMDKKNNVTLNIRLSNDG